jgi:hypothetical protein
MIFQKVRHTRIVLRAIPRPCFFSRAARHRDIISNVVVSGATWPHMGGCFLVRRIFQKATGVSLAWGAQAR